MFCAGLAVAATDGRSGTSWHTPSEQSHPMHKHQLAFALLVAASSVAPPSVCAAKLPPIPVAPIAEKKELLFSDDFNGAPARQGLAQSRADVRGGRRRAQGNSDPRENDPGGGWQAGHYGPRGRVRPGDSHANGVVEVRIRFEGMIDVEFDDRKYTGAHYGHLCRAQVRLNGVTLIDERDGTMRNDIYKMNKDPARKAEAAKLLTGRRVAYPIQLETGKWYTLVVETVGDEMHVTVDGEPAGYLKSSGIAHETKSKIELGVAGKDGLFDDIKVWDAVSSRP